jgi:FeS assembly SUF system protein
MMPDAHLHDDRDLFDFTSGRPEVAGAESPASETSGATDRDLETRVVEALKTVRDPEIPVNLVDLGLIYDLVVEPGGMVRVEMTLTTPHCPVAASMPGEVETAIRAVEGVTDVEVDLVWMPPWNPDRMSEEARLELGLL